MRDFIYKLKIVEEELDETVYFLELLEYFNEAHVHSIKMMIEETNELLAITVSSLRKLRSMERSGKNKFYE